MAAGDINDPLSQIPGIALADDTTDPTDLGAGFALLKFKNGLPVWLPNGGAVRTALALGVVSQLAGLTAEASPQDTDLFLMERASDGALRKVEAQNLPGGGGGGFTQCARVYHNTTQTIPQFTPTALAFNSERYDTDTMHDNATNNSRLTIQTAGKYHVGACVYFPAAAHTYCAIGIYLNGVTIIARHENAHTNGVSFGLTIGTDYDLAQGNYLEVFVWTDWGGGLVIASNANYSPEFWAHRIG